MDLGHARWDDEVIEGLVFIEHSVLQIPYFLMTFMRYVTPTLDNLYVAKELPTAFYTDPGQVHD